eukprot:10627396-Karenia_brevis.AAC.1
MTVAGAEGLGQSTAWLETGSLSDCTVPAISSCAHALTALPTAFLPTELVRRKGITIPWLQCCYFPVQVAIDLLQWRPLHKYPGYGSQAREASGQVSLPCI